MDNSFNDMLASSAPGWKYRVQADGEFQGLHPVNETLTRARARVDFKVANMAGGGPVFDGSNPHYSCFARYHPLIFLWRLDRCTFSDYALDGPNFIYSETIGTFQHVSTDDWESHYMV